MKSKTLALILALVPAVSFASSSKPDTSHAVGKIAVLDLVDMGDNQQHSEISEILRKDLSGNSKWTVVNRDTLNKRLTDFNMNPRQACNNPQCSFDIGNVVQAEYVLFGTSTSFGNIHTVSLKILHIPTAKIAWTKVMEASGLTEAERMNGLEKSLSAAVGEFSQVRPGLDKGKHGRSLAVIDLSENTPQSRAFFDRVCTRIYGNGAYDLMSPTELAELLAALEINKYSIVPSLENMIGLGQKLGVSNLLYSRLYRDGKSFIYRLAMYDVAGKALVLELPPQPSDELIKLLDYEKVFFNTLFSKEKDGGQPVVVKDGGHSNKALWISLGVLGIGGGVAAYWVENLKKSPDNGANNGGSIGQPKLPPPEP